MWENRGFLLKVECQRLTGKHEGNVRAEKLSFCNYHYKDLLRQESSMDAKSRENF